MTENDKQNVRHKRPDHWLHLTGGGGLQSLLGSCRVETSRTR